MLHTELYMCGRAWDKKQSRSQWAIRVVIMNLGNGESLKGFSSDGRRKGLTKANLHFPKLPWASIWRTIWKEHTWIQGDESGNNRSSPEGRLRWWGRRTWVLQIPRKWNQQELALEGIWGPSRIRDDVGGFGFRHWVFGGFAHQNRKWEKEKQHWRRSQG